MTEEKQQCQVCNMQYDEGITARKDFVVPLEHLDRDLPEVFHDQSIERLRFCSVKCFFEFMIVICEKSKKQREEQKPTNSTEKENVCKTYGNCETCGNKTDYDKKIVTQCVRCCKHFCTYESNPSCFMEHRKKDGCSGWAVTNDYGELTYHLW